MKATPSKWVARAVSADTTRERLTAMHIVAMPATSEASPARLPAIALCATDGHRLHLAPAAADAVVEIDGRWLVAPLDSALGACKLATNPIGTVERLRAACDLADAVAEEQFYRARADVLAEGIKAGKAPERDELPDRTPGSVIIDGAGLRDDVCLNADFVRDALAGMPRHAKIKIFCGSALDPAIILRTDDELALIMPMRLEADDRDGCPRIAVVAP